METQAWSEIYQRHFPAIYGYARRRVDSESVAEDVAAQVFLEALERIKDFTYRGIPLAAWLFRIARNLVVTHYRSRSADAREADENLADTQSSPEEAVELGFLRKELKGALTTLTSDQQHMVILRFIEGLDTQEVALVLSKPVGAVKALQHRALASMRRFLAAENRQ